MNLLKNKMVLIVVLVVFQLFTCTFTSFTQPNIKSLYSNFENVVKDAQKKRINCGCLAGMYTYDYSNDSILFYVQSFREDSTGMIILKLSEDCMTNTIKLIQSYMKETDLFTYSEVVGDYVYRYKPIVKHDMLLLRIDVEKYAKE